MYVECWFDGCCAPYNPEGHTGYGAIVKHGSKTLFAKSGYVGVGEGMTNNVGEYSGVIAVMKFLIENGLRQGVIYGDADLVVHQLNGKWKAHKGAYLPYYKIAKELRHQLPEIEIKWIPREENWQADYLAGQSVPIQRTPENGRELKRLIQEQRRDRHDPRFKVIASRPVKGCPF